MLDEFRSALRQLWRKPAIACVAALCLALGAGATAPAKPVSGIAIGLPCALGANYALSSALFGVSPWYAPAFLVGAAVMLAAASLAALIPAFAAARLDPLSVLRDE